MGQMLDNEKTPRYPVDLFDLTRMGAATPWIEVAQLILVTARRVRGRLAAEGRRHGLCESEVEMLLACAKAPAGGRSQNELADDLAVSAAHISGVVERLRVAGLLQCATVQSDRRLRLWQLTPAGRAIWRALSNDSAGQEEAA